MPGLILFLKGIHIKKVLSPQAGRLTNIEEGRGLSRAIGEWKTEIIRSLAYESIPTCMEMASFSLSAGLLG
jgi:hypothetical protein